MSPTCASSDRRPLVAVLGATGLLGSAVAARLAREQVRLRLVARRAASPPAGADADVRTADLTAAGAVERAVAGADVVIPMVLYTGGGTWRTASGAAEREAARVNVGVPEAVVRCAEDGAAVVFPGSLSQVGTRGAGLIDEGVEDAPIGSYDRQKQAAEDAFLAERRLRATSLRLPTVYGSGSAGAMDRGVVSAMARRALAGEPLTVWDGGTARRDLVHVTDVAEAVAAAIEHIEALAGRHWVIGTGDGVSVRELFARVARAVADRTGTAAVPVTSVPAPSDATAVDGRDMVGDPSAFVAATGWRPMVALDDGIADTVEKLLAAGRYRRTV